MRVLLLCCHPLQDSFQGALHRTIKAALERAGHAVDDLDLYREGFDPVLSRTERIGYHDTARSRRLTPTLRNIRTLAAVTTYGRPRRVAWLMGDPPRKMVRRHLRHLVGRGAAVRYLAHYAIDSSTPERRSRFLAKVERTMLKL